jgi:hypothetical protein
LQANKTLKQRDVEGISFALGINMLKLVVIYLRPELFVIANEDDNGLLANEPTGGEQSGGVVEVERGAIGGEV